jgi:hypothetical protein
LRIALQDRRGHALLPHPQERPGKRDRESKMSFRSLRLSERCSWKRYPSRFGELTLGTYHSAKAATTVVLPTPPLPTIGNTTGFGLRSNDSLTARSVPRTEADRGWKFFTRVGLQLRNRKWLSTLCFSGLAQLGQTASWTCLKELR